MVMIAELLIIKRQSANDYFPIYTISMLKTVVSVVSNRDVGRAVECGRGGWRGLGKAAAFL